MLIVLVILKHEFLFYSDFFFPYQCKEEERIGVTFSQVHTISASSRDI